MEYAMPMKEDIKSLKGKRGRDLLIYATIGFVVAGLMFTAIIHGLGKEFFTKWIAFPAISVFLGLLFLEHSREMWRQQTFWLLFTIFWLIHYVA